MAEYDLAVAFLGYGDASQVNINELLDDYLPDEVLATIPWHVPENAPGIVKVSKFLKDVGIEPESHAVDNIIDWLFAAECARKELIILGSKGIESEVKDAQLHGWKVSDLTRGLFAPEMPPDGSERQSEGQTGSPPTPSKGERENRSEGRTDLSTGWNADDPPWSVEDLSTVPLTRDEVYEIVTGLIQVHEAQYHGKGTVKENSESLPGYLDNGAPEAVPSVPQVQKVQQVSQVTEVPVSNVTTIVAYEEEQEGTVKYYRNDKGYRKAGKSKKRPSETAVWIPQSMEDQIPPQ